MTSVASVRQGRPRDPEIDRAILNAVLDEVAALGFSGASIAGVARRAGVPTSTVYRRWDSKQDLVLEAARALLPGLPRPSGHTVADLSAVIAHLAMVWQDRRAADVLSSLITESRRNADMDTWWQAQGVGIVRERVRDLVRDGVNTGQLRDDTDDELITEMILAVPFHLAMRMGHVDTSDLARRFMHTILDGIAVTRPLGRAVISSGGECGSA